MKKRKVFFLPFSAFLKNHQQLFLTVAAHLKKNEEDPFFTQNNLF